MIKIRHSFKSSRRLNLGREKKKVIYTGVFCIYIYIYISIYIYVCVEVEGKKAVFGLQPP